MTPTTEKQLREWREAGLTMRQIAANLDMPANAAPQVHAACRVLGISRPVMSKDAAIVEALRSGKTAKAVAQELGVHPNTVGAAAARALSANR